MIAFLLTMVVLGGCMFAGLCGSLYLRGVIGTSSQMQPATVESLSLQAVRAAEMEERDYGVRYARVGIAIVACVMLLLMLGVLFAIFALL